MRTAMGQTRFIAPLTKPDAEAGGREGFAVIGDQKCLAAGQLCFGNHIRQVGMNRDVHLNRAAVLIFRLNVPQAAVRNVLLPKASGVLSAAGGIKQQSES
jgi:hypothetical protein